MALYETPELQVCFQVHPGAVVPGRGGGWKRHERNCVNESSQSGRSAETDVFAAPIDRSQLSNGVPTNTGAQAQERCRRSVAASNG